MRPLEALEAARAAGIEVQVDGKDLVVSAAGELPADILDMLRRHKADIVELLRPPLPGGSPSSPVARPRCWSTADWRAFHNDRQLVAEIALGKTRQQPRTYAFTHCVEEWHRVRPGSTEDQAITALAEKGITDPSPPSPALARHKAAIVEHLQVTWREDDLPVVPAGGGGAGADVTDSPAPITASQRAQEDEWSSEDWRTYRDERAAIAEYDDKLARPQAEGRAYRACLAEWLDQHPVSSKADDGCRVCGATDRPNDSLLPVGLGSGLERTWLHSNCIPIWHSARMAEAASALAVMGVRSPEGGSP